MTRFFVTKKSITKSVTIVKKLINNDQILVKKKLVIVGD